MSAEYAAVIEIDPLEPVVVRGSFSRGGHYSSPSHLPSSTVAGAIMSEFFRSGGRGRLEDRCLWMSHGYPCKEPFSLGEAPPLPLLTLSRRGGEYLSVALLFADAIRLRDPGALRMLRELDKKAGLVYIRSRGRELERCEPPKKEIETHVVMDLEARTAYVGAGDRRGLLYTQEVILPDFSSDGVKFFSLAFLDGEVRDFLATEREIRVGAARGKGFGLVTVRTAEVLGLEEYREIRRRRIGERLGGPEGLITADVVTPTRKSAVLSPLGDPIYERVRLTDLKTWLSDKVRPRAAFRVYRNLLAQGSVLVYGVGDIGVETLVGIETSPPSDPVARLNGVDMVFFGNSVHVISLSKLMR